MGNKLFGKLLAGGVIVVLAGLSMACYSLWGGGNGAVEQAAEPPRQANYKSFAASWNDSARKYSSAFRLMGADATSPQRTLDMLAKWCRAFSRKPSPQFEKELRQLGEEVPPSTFHAYEKFRQDHYRDSAPEFSQDMDSRQLAQALNSYIGLKANGAAPDYVTPETVRTIVYMNSFCQFFESEKDRLHAQKIDTLINTCERLHTNGKYPELDKLLN